MQQSAQQRREFRLMEAPTEFGLGQAQFDQRFVQGFREFGRIVGPTVGQQCPSPVPNPLVRVEFGGVGRQGFQVDSPTAAQQRADGVSLVGAAVVPDYDDEAAQMVEQMAQKIGHLDVIEVGFRQTTEVETEMAAFRADRQSGDEGDLLSPHPVAVDRRLSAGSPGAPHGWNQQEATLVDEDEMGAQVLRPLFILGHSSRFQRSISSSSRSSALRSGFWQLNPRPCRSRPMWSRWYLTPNLRAMTSATRAVVHRSVRYPWASAPLTNSPASFCCW